MKKVVVHYTIGFHYPIEGGVETDIRDFVRMTPEYEHVVLCKNGGSVMGGITTAQSVEFKTACNSSQVPEVYREKYQTVGKSYEFDGTTLDRIKSLNPWAIVMYEPSEGTRDMCIPLLELDIPVKIFRSQGFPCRILDLMNLVPTAQLVSINDEGWDDMGSKCQIRRIMLPKVYDNNIFKNNNVARVPNSFVYTGRIHEVKGIIPLIRAYKDIFNRGITISLDIVGSCNPSPYLKEVKSALSGTRINFYNRFVSHEQLSSILNSSEFIVIPSPAESFCASALEGLACGCGLLINNDTMPWSDGLCLNGMDLSEDRLRGLILVMENALMFGRSDFSKVIYEKYSYDANRNKWAELLK